MNKKILKFGKMVALFLVAMSCSKDNSSKDEVLPHAEERISSITLENLPQSIKEKLKEQIATDVFLHLQEEVTIIENEKGIKTYSVGMKQGADIEEVMKNQKTISLAQKTPCFKRYDNQGNAVFTTILIGGNKGNIGTPFYVNAVNHGDYIETSFTNLNDGSTSVTWTPNPHSPTFGGDKGKGGNGYFGAFFGNIWTGIKTLGDGINSLGKGIKSIFKKRHCGCPPGKKRRPAEGNPAYVHTTDATLLSSCCEGEAILDEDFDFLMPNSFLENQVQITNITKEQCDCILKNPLNSIEDDFGGVVLRAEDKALLDCACMQGDSSILAQMLGFHMDMILELKDGKIFFNEICSFLKESNYTSEAFAFAKEAVIAKEKGGEVNFKERLILTSSFINNPRLKCIYKNFYRGNNTISQYLKNFLKDGPKGYLKISVDFDFGANWRKHTSSMAITIPPKNNIIEIVFNTDTKLLSSVNNNSTLSVGLALIHEVLHAEMFRKLLEASDTSFVPKKNTPEWENLFGKLYHSFYEYFDLYTRISFQTNNPTDVQHQLMAQNYIETLATALAEFDRNQYSEQFYKEMVWIGLEKTNAYKKLPRSVQLQISETVKKARNGTKDCHN